MPFDLHSVCATFQKLLNAMLGPDKNNCFFLGKTWKEQKSSLESVFRKCRHAKLLPNPEKCTFFQTSLKYRGQVVSERGISTDPDKVKAIQDMLRRCLGVASRYREFVPTFARITEPLTCLLRKNHQWECSDFSETFKLQVDASDQG